MILKNQLARKIINRLNEHPGMPAKVYNLSIEFNKHYQTLQYQIDLLVEAGFIDEEDDGVSVVIQPGTKDAIDGFLKASGANNWNHVAAKDKAINNDTCMKIVEYLYDCGSKTTKEIAEHFGMASQNASKYLNTYLKPANFIRKNRRNNHVQMDEIVRYKVAVNELYEFLNN